MVYKPHMGNGFFMCDTIFLAYLLHIDMAPKCDTIFVAYMRHFRSSNMCDIYKRFQLCIFEHRSFSEYIYVSVFSEGGVSDIHKINERKRKLSIYAQKNAMYVTHPYVL